MMTLSPTWQAEAAAYLKAGDFAQVASLYELAIEQVPTEIPHYWHLGLAYVLQDDLAAAQTTWLYVFSQGDEVEQTMWLSELINFLEESVTTQAQLKQLSNCWLIHHSIRELDNRNFNNLLKLVELAIQFGQFEPEYLVEWQVSECLQTTLPDRVDVHLFQKVLRQVIPFVDLPTLEFAKLSLNYIELNQFWVDVYADLAKKVGSDFGYPDLALDLLEACLIQQPENLDLLYLVPRFQLKIQNYQAAIASAKRVAELCQNPIQKTLGISLLFNTLISAGQWQDLAPVVLDHKNNIEQLTLLPEISLDSGVLQSLIANTGNLAYINDDLVANRHYQHLAGQLIAKHLHTSTAISHLPTQASSDFPQSKVSKLKIGYIGGSFKRHSVSWLNRWLFAHHNRQDFEIHIYAFGEVSADPFFQTWFQPHVDSVNELSDDLAAAISKIRQDGIQILVDLDSYTLDYTCMVMAAKPAPVQLTWLGTDASGISTIDYYIADDYVLPDYAEEHYQEKLWRLPQTYIAVDEFEIGEQTLTRELLGIPNEAVIYFSSQAIFKRNPEIVRLQLEIIKQVPNSYFLIKGLGDPRMLHSYFTELAQEVGTDPSCLRFLENTATEAEHRANLKIADVILDTYPYSGATTTLEALWVGVPLVTRVGETFSSRNSYAFLMNVGIMQGIATSAKEYVEWGVRFGVEESLRQQVMIKLRESRYTSPLWNAQKFAKEMENAYEQMWQIYLQENSSPQSD
jgi:predicted O-linked N-acetylglucosamine transferase (SPINDLY family)